VVAAQLTRHLVVLEDDRRRLRHVRLAGTHPPLDHGHMHARIESVQVPTSGPAARFALHTVAVAERPAATS
jgi:hypothetical protein